MVPDTRQKLVPGSAKNWPPISGKRWSPDLTTRRWPDPAISWSPGPTVAVVGATSAGKTTLIEALCTQRGVCSRPSTDFAAGRHGSPQRPACGLDVRHFETKSAGADASTCSVSAFVVSTDNAFNYVRQFHVDLYLLVVDLTAFESSPRGGATTSGLVQQQQHYRQQWHQSSPTASLQSSCRES